MDDSQAGLVAEMNIYILRPRYFESHIYNFIWETASKFIVLLLILNFDLVYVMFNLRTAKNGPHGNWTSVLID